MKRISKRTMRSEGAVRHCVCVEGVGGGEGEGEDPKSYCSGTSQTVPARPSSIDNSVGTVGHCEE